MAKVEHLSIQLQSSGPAAEVVMLKKRGRWLQFYLQGCAVELEEIAFKQNWRTFWRNCPYWPISGILPCRGSGGLALLGIDSKDTVCPSGGGVGQSLSTGISSRSPPPPPHPPTTTTTTATQRALTCGISNSARMQIQARHRACASERGEERGSDKCRRIPKERASSPFLLLPLFPPGLPVRSGREGLWTRAADAANRAAAEGKILRESVARRQHLNALAKVWSCAWIHL